MQSHKVAFGNTVLLSLLLLLLLMLLIGQKFESEYATNAPYRLLRTRITAYVMRNVQSHLQKTGRPRLFMVLGLIRNFPEPTSIGVASYWALGHVPPSTYS